MSPGGKTSGILTLMTCRARPLSLKATGQSCQSSTEGLVGSKDHRAFFEIAIIRSFTTWNRTLAASQLHVREVRPSDFRDRVAKWFRNIPERKTSNPNYLGSFTTENGAGAKGEMGKD